MQTSDIIAAIALLASIASAIITWKVHSNSAGRVNIRMQAAAYFPFAGTGAVANAESGEMHLSQFSSLSGRTVAKGPRVEFVRIVLENPGRTGVTVTKVGLQVSGVGRSVWNVTPRDFSSEDKHFGNFVAKLPVRIEAYDQKIMYLDFWSVVDSAFRENPRELHLTVRATASVAGHAHEFTSRRSGNWRIPKGFVSFGPNRYVRPISSMFLLSTVRHERGCLDVTNYLDQVSAVLDKEIQQGDSLKTIEQKIEDALIDPTSNLYPDEVVDSAGIIAWDIKEYLNYAQMVKRRIFA